MAPKIGTRAACAAAGVPQATWYRRHRLSPAPQRPVPVPHADAGPAAGAGTGRAAGDPGRAAQRAGSLTRRRPRCGRCCWMRAPTWDRCPPITGCCARPARAGSGARRPPTPPRSSPSWLPTGPNQVYSWDITKLHGPAKWTYYHLYVILDIYQPVRRGLDGRHPRVRRPGREAHRRDLRQAGHRPRAADHPRRPRLLDDLQAGRAAARRPRRHPVPLPAPRVQRQPVLRSAVQDARNTGPASPPGSPRSKPPGRTARTSSPGTTTSTATAGSACTPPPTSTTAAPQPSGPGAPRS